MGLFEISRKVHLNTCKRQFRLSFCIVQVEKSLHFIYTFSLKMIPHLPHLLNLHKHVDRLVQVELFHFQSCLIKCLFKSNIVNIRLWVAVSVSLEFSLSTILTYVMLLFYNKTETKRIVKYDYKH